MVKLNVNNVNGIYVSSFELDIYDLDTQKSALTRLASKIETIPKYLYFPDGIPSIERLKEKDPIVVENLLAFITESNDIDFITLMNKLTDKIDQQNLKIQEDVLLPFIAFNKVYEDIGYESLLAPFMLLTKQIKDENLLDEKSSLTDIQLLNFWEKERVKTVKRFSEEVGAVLRQAKQQEEMYKDYDKVRSKIIYTPFEKESVDFKFFLDLNNITMIEIFNHLILTPELPFATTNEFFKIFKDFNPPKSWEMSRNSSIIFKVLQKKTLDGVKPEDYANGFLIVDEKQGTENIIVNMSLLTSGNFLPRDDIIERFVGSIHGLGIVNVKDIIEKSIKGCFYFPKHSLNKYVFADLLLNNPLFSSMMSINESEKASKKKESVYIHFYNSKIGKLTANITEKKSARNDSDLRGKDINGAFKFGTTYIRVKISIAENIEAVLEFQNLFSKLLTIYDQKYEEIIAFYNLYIPGFGSDTDKLLSQTKQPKISKQSIKDIAPEVFVTGYPGTCAHQPTIIDDDDKEALEEAIGKDKQIMRYPSKGEPFPPRNYVCNYTDSKYPGLQENRFEKNNDIVPYLPCCFKKDNNIPDCGSILRYYKHEEALKDKSASTQQDLITTKKFAPADKYGTLPDNLTKMFEIFDYDEEYIYVRKGVHEAKSSFLECVMEGMYKKTGILDVEDRKDHISKVRDLLATAANAAACRQEMYDYSINQIIDIIRNPSLYMEPSLFTSFLEQHFGCNIFVFSRSENNAKLNIPRHLHGYYKNEREANCIFIYEHKGSQINKEKGTRCELIVRWRKTDKHDLSYYYPYRSKVSRGVRDVYTSMKQSYTLSNEIQEASIPIIDTAEVKFLEQGFDSYGKCRMLRFRFQDRTLGSILTDPLQPFVIPESRNWIATKTTKNNAIKLARVLKIDLTGQYVRDTYLKEIYGNFGTVKVTIPVNDSTPIDGLQIDNDRIINPTSKSSALNNHNKYKKLARYVVEYMFWLFSKYLQEDGGKTPITETINKFIQDKIKIDPDFEYGKVSEIFSEDSGVMEDGKLVVKSEETLKRLVYTLRLSLRRFRDKIYKYHERKTIEKFYIDVTDFDQHPRQIILYGENSIDKWNQEKNRKNVLYNSVQIDLDTPYFFKNQYVNAGVIYLAQNTPTLKKAMEIGKTWISSRFNLGGEASGIDIPSFEFELYRYINSKDIVLYKVEGDPNSFKIKVLGWKLNGVSSFAVLLPV